jgi:hypothetical protein
MLLNVVEYLLEQYIDICSDKIESPRYVNGYRPLRDSKSQRVQSSGSETRYSDCFHGYT